MTIKDFCYFIFLMFLKHDFAFFQVAFIFKLFNQTTHLLQRRLVSA